MTAPAPRSDHEIRADVERHNALASLPGYQPEQDDVDDRLAVDAGPLLARALAAEARVAEVEHELQLVRATIANYGDALTRVGGR